MEFILLLVSSLLLTARAAAVVSNPVFDTDGNELRRGHLYYAMSVMRPRGGLTLAAPNTAPCPLNVALAPFNDNSGRPLAFFPENTNEDTVQEGSSLNIMFPEPTGCPQSTVWTFDNKAGVVTTGGTKPLSGAPENSRFVIHKAGDGASSSQRYYQVEACPCGLGCRKACFGLLSLRKGEETIVLAINNERPHTVMFVKAKQEARGSQ